VQRGPSTRSPGCAILCRREERSPRLGGLATREVACA
jgi:hypothetical protein